MSTWCRRDLPGACVRVGLYRVRVFVPSEPTTALLVSAFRQLRTRWGAELPLRWDCPPSSLRSMTHSASFFGILPVTCVGWSSLRIFKSAYYDSTLAFALWYDFGAYALWSALVLFYGRFYWRFETWIEVLEDWLFGSVFALLVLSLAVL